MGFAINTQRYFHGFCRVFFPLLQPHILSSLVAQTVKHLPTWRETRVQSLGWEDLLEKEMATHSSILAWKIPWTEEPGGPRGRKELDTTERLHFTILKVVCSVAQSRPTLGTLWTVAQQAPVRGILLARTLEQVPPPGDLPAQGLNLRFLLLHWPVSPSPLSHLGGPSGS